MRMFNVLPRLIKNTVKKLSRFTCNSPKSVVWISKAEFLWRAKAEWISSIMPLFPSSSHPRIVAEKDDWRHSVLWLFEHRRQAAVDVTA